MLPVLHDDDPALHENDPALHENDPAFHDDEPRREVNHLASVARGGLT